jgi:hypothetical protein
VASFRTTAPPWCGGRHLRRLNLIPDSLRDLVAVVRGVARGRHGRAEFEKRRLEREGEMADTLSNEHAQYLKESGERVTPDISVTNFHIARHCDGCRSGSWEGLMGHVADARRPTPHDDSRSYGEGDSEVKVTRLVTGALRRPLRGKWIRSGASSQEATRRLAAHYFAAFSRTTSWSQLAQRWPGEFRKAQLRRPERPSRTVILGLR